SFSKNVDVQGGEIAYTLSPGRGDEDGEGVVLNGPSVDVRLSGLRIHHNASAAIAIFDLDTSYSGEGVDRDSIPGGTYELSGNSIWGNGLKNSDPSISVVEYPEFLLVWGNRSRALVHNNWISKSPGNHLVEVFVESRSADTWRDDLWTG